MSFVIRLLPAVTLFTFLITPSISTAHDIENTHGLITFSSYGQYQIDVLNDANWMWLRLVGRKRRCRLPRSVTILFAGEPATIDSVQYLPPVSPAQTDAIGLAEPELIRLRGPVPADATTLYLGVEMGQLTVIGTTAAAVMGTLQKEWYRRRVAVPTSIAITAMGLYWTIERLFL